MSSDLGTELSLEDGGEAQAAGVADAIGEGIGEEIAVDLAGGTAFEEGFHGVGEELAEEDTFELVGGFFDAGGLGVGGRNGIDFWCGEGGWRGGERGDGHGFS